MTVPLNGKQFTLFHGARQQLPAGETHILPPSKTGAPTWASAPYKHDDGTSHTETAFASPYEHVASSYMIAGSSHRDAEVNNDPDPKYRSALYEVAVPKDAVGDPRRDTEIGSKTGFPIVGMHHSISGATGTFPEVNWNAFKAKRPDSQFVAQQDMNHSYMDTHAPTHALDSEKLAKAETPRTPYREAPAGGYRNRDEPDPRHLDQLNLFSGKTVAEHRAFESTPGVMMHLHGDQFADQKAAFANDPTVKTIRRSKEYHRADEQLGTIH